MTKRVLRTLWVFEAEKHEHRFTSDWRKYLPEQLSAFIDLEFTKNWTMKIVRTAGAKSQDQLARSQLHPGHTAAQARQIARFQTHLRNRSVRAGDRLLFLDAWHAGIAACQKLSWDYGINVTIDVMWQSDSLHFWGEGRSSVLKPSERKAYLTHVLNHAERSYFPTLAQWRDVSNRLKVSHMADRAHIVGWPMEYISKVVGDTLEDAKKDLVLFPLNSEDHYRARIAEVLQPVLPNYKLVAPSTDSISRRAYLSLVRRAAAVVATGREDCLGAGIYEGVVAGATPIVPNLHSYNEIYGAECMPSPWTSLVVAVQRNKRQLADFIEQRIAQNTAKRTRSRASQVVDPHFQGAKLYASVLR